MLIGWVDRGVVQNESFSFSPPRKNSSMNSRVVDRMSRLSSKQHLQGLNHNSLVKNKSNLVYLLSFVNCAMISFLKKLLDAPVTVIPL